MDSFISYLPDVTPSNPGPLARFLPPLEDGTVAAWLTERVPAGAWLLEPFGFSPQLAVEAARAGYRVLVAANNPVTRFLLECRADPPAASDLRAALAELASARRGDERLESHIQSLYLTDCAACQKQVPAQAFLWRKGADVPYARIYTCQACGDHGERLAAEADTARAARAAETGKLHRARILERVAPLDDPDREYAEEALSHYLPRPLYALATLINRLDSLELAPARHRALQALLLTACDTANSLWPHPTQRPRPKQLTTPAQFRENNVWLALEDGLGLWPHGASPVPVTIWPQVPPGAGVCIFDGRLKDLAMHAKDMPFQAVVTAIPRPNQAFWTLSALWAGWLWGREAAASFKVVLRRRRYDWDWHAEALQAAFTHLSGLLAPDTPFFGLLAEAEPPFLNAVLSAADISGFDLETIALRTVHDPVQVGWKRAVQPERPASPPDPELVRSVLCDYLRERGEAATYLHLYTAGLAALAQGRLLTRPAQAISLSLAQTNTLLQQSLRSAEGLVHYESGSHALETGLWGLASDIGQAEPLPDRVEMELVRFLARNPNCTLVEIERGLYPHFPGLVTPPRALTGAVLASYGVEREGRWCLRPEDLPAARRVGLEEIASLLGVIGGRLSYVTSRPEPRLLLWKDGDNLAYAFYLIASAITGRIFACRPYPPAQSLLVLPGGRASLLAYKLRRDPLLRQKAQGWRFIKFRLVRSLADIPVINRQTWDEQVNSDPVEQTVGQMMMF